MGLLTIILNERDWKERVRQPRLRSHPAPVQPPANRAAQPPRRGRSASQGSLECSTALWVRRREDHSCNPSLWQRPLRVCKSWKSVGVSTERLIQASVLQGLERGVVLRTCSASVGNTEPHRSLPKAALCSQDFRAEIAGFSGEFWAVTPPYMS